MLIPFGHDIFFDLFVSQSCLAGILQITTPPIVPLDAAPQKRRRRAPVPRVGVIDESIVAGSPEDSYCPCTNQNGTVDSPVWFFFRMRKTERALAHPTCNRCYCQIPGCKFDGGVAQRTSSGGTKALWRHLAKHGWKVTTEDEKAAVGAEQAERVAGGLAPRDNPAADPAPPKPRRELAAAARDRRETKAAEFADTWAEGVGAKQPDQFGARLVLPKGVVRHLHVAWAAKVVVCDLRPTTMGEGVGVASFITEDLIPALVSECTWQPPSHQVIVDILAKDFMTLKAQLKVQLEEVDRCEMILHADVWTDDWHRHWLGGILEWLSPSTGARQSRLICFEELEKWTNDVEGHTPEMAQTVATALRAAWRSLDLGAEPACLCTDNAAPAVAIASALSMASLRCGCHLLVIPMRHLLWGREASIRGRVTRETPIEPQVL